MNNFDITIELSAEHRHALVRAFSVTAANLMPPAGLSTYDEEAGVYVRPPGDLAALQIHLRGFAIRSLHALHSALDTRKKCPVSPLTGITWAPAAPAGPFQPHGGTLTLDGLGVQLLGEMCGLAWQVALCRVGRSSAEDEARSMAVNDVPECVAEQLEIVRSADSSMRLALRAVLNAPGLV